MEAICASVRRPRRWLMALAALGLPLVSAACGADDSADAADGEATVVIEDFAFLDGDTTLPAGTTVVFDNRDDTAHTATARDGQFTTGSIAGGTSASVTVEDAGEFTYFCSFHPFMEASITAE